MAKISKSKVAKTKFALNKMLCLVLWEENCVCQKKNCMENGLSVFKSITMCDKKQNNMKMITTTQQKHEPITDQWLIHYRINVQ